MSVIMILGESGAGKSTSLRNLNPKETIIFSTLGKGLPFQGSQKNYTKWHKENNPEGNLIVTSSAAQIIQWLNFINNKMPHIKTIVIDDSTFLMAKELDRRRDEVGFKKFNDIAHDFLAISEVAHNMRQDLNVYFVYHITTEGDGILENKKIRAISSGKLIQEKLGSIEAQFEIVLLACKITNNEQIEYKFKTRDVDSTAKTPVGLFEETFIDNDLALVNDAIDCYYRGENCKQEVKTK